MKAIIIKLVKFLIFFTLGLFIFWLIYKDQDINRIKSVLKNEVNYFWILVSLLIGLVSHISRTIRWQMMIEPISHKPGFINTFMAVMIGYLMNLALPRMGEISRCGVLNRYERISFVKLFGTVVAERLIDVLSLLILLGFVIIAQFGQMLNFLQNNPEIKSKLKGIFSSPILFILLIISAVLVFIFRKKIMHSAIYLKVAGLLKNFRDGFISIRSIKQKGWFWFHSAFIWICYYLMLYTIFFAFDFTNDLNPVAGLTTFVLASFGMVAPVQGGIGAWHFMAIQALSLYGVASENGVIFAFVAHTSMTVMIILIGLLSMLTLPFINSRKDVDDDGLLITNR